VSWAERSEQWLGELGVAYETHRYPVDHLFNADMQMDFLAWADALIADMPKAASVTPTP
jgi:hypothetical protein